jgi:dTDP-4-dehydrorhamnose reductase
MRILLIGADGQLARDLGQHVLGHDVVPLTHEQLEISDAQAVRQAVKRFLPDCIINTAAFHNVDECEEQPERSFLVNAVGVYNLAREAENCGARLVHFSTDYVFDGRSKVPYLEEDRPGPLSVYATSKLAGEGLARRYCQRHFVIRTCGLYGEGGNRSKGGNFVERMLRLASAGKSLRVVADQVLTPTSTADLGEHVARLLSSDAFGLYHMTNTGQCSWYEFTREVFRLAHVAADLQPTDSASYSAKARRPEFSVLDNAAMRRLGIPEFRPWQEAIAAYMHRRGKLGAG